MANPTPMLDVGIPVPRRQRRPLADGRVSAVAVPLTMPARAPSAMAAPAGGARPHLTMGIVGRMELKGLLTGGKTAHDEASSARPAELNADSFDSEVHWQRCTVCSRKDP